MPLLFFQHVDAFCNPASHEKISQKHSIDYAKIHLGHAHGYRNQRGTVSLVRHQHDSVSIETVWIRVGAYCMRKVFHGRAIAAFTVSVVCVMQQQVR